MKAARILVLGVTLAAGGAAAFLMAPGQEQKPRAHRVIHIEITGAPIAQGKTGTLSPALRDRFDIDKVTEEDAGRKTGSAPFALVSAVTNDAS